MLMAGAVYHCHAALL